MRGFSLLMVCVGLGCGTDQTVTIEIDPTSVPVIMGGRTASFSCTVTDENPSNQRSESEWSIDEGAVGGSLAPDPLSDVYMIYTAPAAPGFFHVSCAARADTSVKATASIGVAVP